VLTLTWTRRLALLLGAILIALATACDDAVVKPPTEPLTAKPRTLTIAAASDLKFALDELIAAFGQPHAGIDVKVTYGSSGNLFAQLSNEAPFDMFFSADLGYPRKLIEAGQASKESEFQYAVGHLIVWVPRDSPLDLETRGGAVLTDPAVKKIAIANPAHAPYGRAAEASLRTLGVYESVKDKLVLGENVAQAAQFAASGNADVGVIALSLALSPPMRGEGRFWTVPEEWHPRLDQGGVILNWARDADAALEFRAFVLGEEGKTILRGHGFFIPEPQDAEP
jgi:molybdate transport system substrate-binding protein